MVPFIFCRKGNLSISSQASFDKMCLYLQADHLLGPPTVRHLNYVRSGSKVY